jgi:RimJ/RimL family protein N-acetyltransferase
MKNILLETERLILRKPELADAKEIQEGADNINVAKQMIKMPHPYTLEYAKQNISEQIKEWEKEFPNNLSFVIELKSEEKVIGGIGLCGIDHENKFAKTRSWLNEAYWKNGYITEAKIALNTFAFNDLMLDKLVSGVLVENKASINAQKKMGYEFKEVKEKEVTCLSTGITHDINLYELTKRKWNIILSMIKDSI